MGPLAPIGYAICIWLTLIFSTVVGLAVWDEHRRCRALRADLAWHAEVLLREAVEEQMG